jgi:hypothetical protein
MTQAQPTEPLVYKYCCFSGGSLFFRKFNGIVRKGCCSASCSKMAIDEEGMLIN